MSADIIQFNGVRPKHPKRRQQRQHNRHSDEPDHDAIDQRATALMRKIIRDKETEKNTKAVCCVVDGKLYEVKFDGADVKFVYGVSDRIRDGKIVKMKWRIFEPGHAIICAARRARGADDNLSLRDARLAQLRERYAQLMRNAERTLATIAALEQQAAS